MCGILVYKQNGNNKFIQKRGPDYTNTVKFEGFNFVHNLLAITGEFSPQPYIDGNIVMIYNGEIYNHKFNKSDGEVIIPLYKKYGVDFPKYLDGEWAIALYDFDKNIAVYSTDLFGTKPMWKNGDEVASYKSGVGGDKVQPNTIIVRNLKTGDEKISQVHLFDFDNQHKTDYQDWISAFDMAVKKRASNRCFIGMSSGYDSGAIACSLNKLDIEWKAYSIYGSEDRKIIDERQEIVKGITIDMKKIDFDRVSKYLSEWGEKYSYNLSRSNGVTINSSMYSDNATVGLGYICEQAGKEGRKVYLSGQGADEITSDYNKFPGQGEIIRFPDRLKIWRNFYGNYQEAYIMKEELIGGAYGVETRYPFLDKDVVQEFLWLHQDLKNRNYKAPIREYLLKNKFPFAEGKKIGFNPQKNLC